MNKDIMQGKWRELKGRAKEQWGQLTDDDLEKVEGRSDRLIGLLQQRYSYAKEKAEQEYKSFTEKWSSNGGNVAGRQPGDQRDQIRPPQQSQGEQGADMGRGEHQRQEPGHRQDEQKDEQSRQRHGSPAGEPRR